MAGFSEPRAIGIAFALFACAVAPLRAQLISPGKLSAAHADLEGVRHCTDCHQLRERGITNANCLACHKPLAHVIAAGTGYHARVADKNCAECHKEHFGTEFQLIRFDTATFKHGDTGFDLAARHAELRCRQCHTPKLIAAQDVRDFKQMHGTLAKTFLGLPTTCVGCHEGDDPHGTQFRDRSCDACHSQRKWKPAAKFDHDSTRYALTGKHRDLACAQCHHPLPGQQAPRLWYVGLDFAACTACHRDLHRGEMGQDCTRCHATTGWRAFDRTAFERRFDHSQTGFRLEGKHAPLRCDACHSVAQAARRGIELHFASASPGTMYPKPDSRTCRSCHTDYHEGAFLASAGGAECDRCHTQGGWVPTTYDLARHDSTRFRLEGAHRAVPCFGCHQVQADTGTHLVFRIEDQTCRACHTAQDPHAGQFAGEKCDACHAATTFRIAAFDHSTTRFPLDSRHQEVPCDKCHPIATTASGRQYRVYRPLGTRCRDCHETRT
jgi:hypothetical protein